MDLSQRSLTVPSVLDEVKLTFFGRLENATLKKSQTMASVYRRSMTSRESLAVLLNGQVLEFSPMTVIADKLPYFADPVISRSSRVVLNDPDLDVQAVRSFFSLVLDEIPFSSIPADPDLRRQLLVLCRCYGFEALESHLRVTSTGSCSNLFSMPASEGFSGISAFFISAV
jgi:hypothetical protein